MRIGMLLPSGYGLHDPGAGRRVQAYKQAEALEALGHEVVRMDAWRTVERESIDVLHLYEGGFGNYAVFPGRPAGFKRIVLAPFIDSNTPFWLYRLAAAAHLRDRMYTPQYVLRQQARNSDVVIARSSHERERLMRSLGVPSEKVAIVLNGADPPVSEPDGEGVRKRLGLPERFVLHVSIYTEARKNVPRLVEATGRLGYPLVIAGTGQEGPALQALRAQVAASQGRVRLLGFVDPATLQGLYAACEVFALPSSHEGTGLAALEAARLGAKVVITRNGGPPDYFGQWARYVDPASVEDIASGLRTTCEAARGPELAEHVKGLTWENSARQLIAAYQRE